MTTTNETPLPPYEEGGDCPAPGCSGVLEYSKPENCSCHINPPCGACTSTFLLCPECGWEDDNG